MGIVGLKGSNPVTKLMATFGVQGSINALQLGYLMEENVVAKANSGVVSQLLVKITEFPACLVNGTAKF